MKLMTAQEARQLVDMGKVWRENHLLDILEKTMNDIRDAALSGKTAITMEVISNEVNLSAFESELSERGFNVKVLRGPWPPRSVEVSW
ncbi:MAG: hypothetical protein K2P57_01135 [Burkholderiales bacterium]|nr:hypothetical protein [Burkholderiales bacterium]